MIWIEPSSAGFHSSAVLDGLIWSKFFPSSITIAPWAGFLPIVGDLRSTRFASNALPPAVPLRVPEPA